MQNKHNGIKRLMASILCIAMVASTMVPVYADVLVPDASTAIVDVGENADGTSVVVDGVDTNAVDAGTGADSDVILDAQSGEDDVAADESAANGDDAPEDGEIPAADAPATETADPESDSTAATPESAEDAVEKQDAEAAETELASDAEEMPVDEAAPKHDIDETGYCSICGENHFERFKELSEKINYEYNLGSILNYAYNGDVDGFKALIQEYQDLITLFDEISPEAAASVEPIESGDNAAQAAVYAEETPTVARIASAVDNAIYGERAQFIDKTKDIFGVTEAEAGRVYDIATDVDRWTILNFPGSYLAQAYFHMARQSLEYAPKTEEINALEDTPLIVSVPDPDAAVQEEPAEDATEDEPADGEEDDAAEVATIGVGLPLIMPVPTATPAPEDKGTDTATHEQAEATAEPTEEPSGETDDDEDAPAEQPTKELDLTDISAEVTAVKTAYMDMVDEFNRIMTSRKTALGITTNSEPITVSDIMEGRGDEAIMPDDPTGYHLSDFGSPVLDGDLVVGIDYTEVSGEDLDFSQYQDDADRYSQILHDDSDKTITAGIVDGTGVAIVPLAFYEEYADPDSIMEISIPDYVNITSGDGTLVPLTGDVRARNLTFNIEDGAMGGMISVFTADQDFDVTITVTEPDGNSASDTVHVKVEGTAASSPYYNAEANAEALAKTAEYGDYAIATIDDHELGDSCFPAAGWQITGGYLYAPNDSINWTNVAGTSYPLYCCNHLAWGWYNPPGYFYDQRSYLGYLSDGMAGAWATTGANVAACGQSHEGAAGGGSAGQMANQLLVWSSGGNLGGGTAQAGEDAPQATWYMTSAGANKPANHHSWGLWQDNIIVIRGLAPINLPTPGGPQHSIQYSATASFDKSYTLELHKDSTLDDLDLEGAIFHVKPAIGTSDETHKDDTPFAYKWYLGSGPHYLGSEPTREYGTYVTVTNRSSGLKHQYFEPFADYTEYVTRDTSPCTFVGCPYQRAGLAHYTYGLKPGVDGNGNGLVDVLEDGETILPRFNTSEIDITTDNEGNATCTFYLHWEGSYTSTVSQDDADQQIEAKKQEWEDYFANQIFNVEETSTDKNGEHGINGFGKTGSNGYSDPHVATSTGDQTPTIPADDVTSIEVENENWDGIVAWEKIDWFTGGRLTEDTQFKFYEWSEAAGGYQISPNYEIVRREDGIYTVRCINDSYDRSNGAGDLYENYHTNANGGYSYTHRDDLGRVFYTLDNLGKFKIEEVGSAYGYTESTNGSTTTPRWVKEFTISRTVDDYIFTKDGNKSADVDTNRPWRTRIFINKTDSETGEPITNETQWTLYEWDEAQDAFVVSTNYKVVRVNGTAYNNNAGGAAITNESYTIVPARSDWRNRPADGWLAFEDTLGDVRTPTDNDQDHTTEQHPDYMGGNIYGDATEGRSDRAYTNDGEFIIVEHQAPNGYYGDWSDIYDPAEAGKDIGKRAYYIRITPDLDEKTVYLSNNQWNADVCPAGTAGGSKLITPDGTEAVVVITENSMSKNATRTYDTDNTEKSTNENEYTMTPNVSDKSDTSLQEQNRGKLDTNNVFQNDRILGEISLSKIDLDAVTTLLGRTANGDARDSGQSHADANLNGAKYDLYAAEDIQHPDGKTGVVDYSKIKYGANNNDVDEDIIWHTTILRNSGFTDEDYLPVLSKDHLVATGTIGQNDAGEEGTDGWLTFSNLYLGKYFLVERGTGIAIPVEAAPEGSEDTGNDEIYVLDGKYPEYTFDNSPTNFNKPTKTGNRIDLPKNAQGEYEHSDGSGYVYRNLFSTKNKQVTVATGGGGVVGGSTSLNDNLYISYAEGYLCDEINHYTTLTYTDESRYIEKNTFEDTRQDEGDELDPMMRDNLYEEYVNIHKNNAELESNDQVMKGDVSISKVVSGEGSSQDGNTPSTALKDAGFTLFLISDLSKVREAEAKYGEDYFLNAQGKYDAKRILEADTDPDAPYDGYVDLHYANEATNKYPGLNREDEYLAIARTYEIDADQIAKYNAGLTAAENYRLGRGDGWGETGWTSNTASDTTVTQRNVNGKEYILSELFTNEEGYLRFEGLPYGQYLLVETTIPDDLQVIEPVVIDIDPYNDRQLQSEMADPNGEILTPSAGSDTWYFANSLVDQELELRLRIYKHDAETGERVLIPNIPFQIYYLNEDGTYMMEDVNHTPRNPDDDVPKVVRVVDGESEELDKTTSVFYTNDDGYLWVAEEQLPLGRYRAVELVGPEGFYNEWLDADNQWGKFDHPYVDGTDYTSGLYKDEDGNWYVGSYYLDFEVGTNSLWHATGEKNEAGADIIVFDESETSYFNHETLGVLSIRKTGEIFTGIESKDTRGPATPGTGTATAIQSIEYLNKAGIKERIGKGDAAEHNILVTFNGKLPEGEYALELVNKDDPDDKYAASITSDGELVFAYFSTDDVTGSTPLKAVGDAETPFPIGRYRVSCWKIPDGKTLDEVIEATVEERENELKATKLGATVEFECTSYGYDYKYEDAPLPNATYQITAYEDIYTQDRQVDEDGNRTLWYKAGDIVAEFQTAADGEESCVTFAPNRTTATYNFLEIHKDATGQVSVTLPLGTYLVREVKAPYGYLSNNTGYLVTFEWDNELQDYVYATKIVTLEGNNTVKTDTYDSERADIERNDNVDEDRLLGGTTAQGPYKEPAPHDKRDGTIDSIGPQEMMEKQRLEFYNERQETRLDITKRNSETNSPVAGAKFNIFTMDDIYNAYGEKMFEAGELIGTTAPTGSNGVTFFVGLPIRGELYSKGITEPADGKSWSATYNSGNYMVVEIAQPDGYYFNGEPQYVSLLYAGDTVSVTFATATIHNKPTEAYVSKRDLTNDNELPGATLAVTDQSGRVVEQWVSTTQKHRVYGLKFDVPYTLTEIRAADGYTLAASITFKLVQRTDVNGNPIEENDVYYLNGNNWVLLDAKTVIMRDDVTKVEISKKDITNDDELPGAHLELWDESGNIIDEWTSMDQPHYVEKLPAGKYSLHEESAPDGYLVTADVEFEVSPTGDIQTVTMKDFPDRGPLWGILEWMKNRRNGYKTGEQVNGVGEETTLGEVVNESIHGYPMAWAIFAGIALLVVGVITVIVVIVKRRKKGAKTAASDVEII